MQEQTKMMLKILKSKYMGKNGADDLESAIRDCLTDLIHINDTILEDNRKSMNEHLEGAMEVAAMEDDEPPTMRFDKRK